MGSRKLTADDLERIRMVAKQWGKIIVRQAFGPDGPGLDVDLVQMEAVAQAAVQGLAAGTLESATAQQAQAMGTAHACPTCSHVCTSTPEPRTIQGLDGPFEHTEPACYCPTCRRDFFPSASASEAGQARLHAERGIQDRGSECPSKVP